MSWSKLYLSGGHKGWWSLKGQTISAITLCHKCHFNKSSPRRGWMRSYFTCSTITFRSFHATMLILEDRRAWAGAQTAIWVHTQESFSTRAGNSRTVMFKSMFFRKQKLFKIVFFFFSLWELVWPRDRSWRISLNEMSEGKPLVFLTHPSKFMQ